MGKYSKEIGIITNILLGYFFIVSIVLLLSTSIPTTLNNDKVSAEDWNRHIAWINRILKGDFTTIYEYPPFFHLVMAFPVYFLKENIKYFQIIFAILTSSSILYFIYKRYGKVPTLIMSFLLCTNIVYLTFNSQLIPQEMDYILFPLIVLAYFRNKYALSSIGLIALMYNHLFGIVFFGIIFIYSLLLKRDYLKYAMLVLILSLPIIYIYYTPALLEIYNIITGKITTVVGTTELNFSKTFQAWETAWDIRYTHPLDNFFAFNGFVAWLLLPLVIYLLIKQKTMDDYQKFYIVWMLCFMPVIVYNVLRWSSYFMLPLSIFEVSVIVREIKHEKTVQTV